MPMLKAAVQARKETALESLRDALRTTGRLWRPRLGSPGYGAVRVALAHWRPDFEDVPEKERLALLRAATQWDTERNYKAGPHARIDVEKHASLTKELIEWLEAPEAAAKAAASARAVSRRTARGGGGQIASKPKKKNEWETDSDEESDGFVGSDSDDDNFASSAPVAPRARSGRTAATKKTYQFDSDDDDDADEPMLTQETVEAPPSPAPMEESDEEEFAPEPVKPKPKAAPKATASARSTAAPTPRRLMRCGNCGACRRRNGQPCHTPVPFNPRGKSRFTGVRRDGEKWRAAIGVRGQTIELGHFDDEEDAARAYDAAVVKYRGTPTVNFPGEAPLASVLAALPVLPPVAPPVPGDLGHRGRCRGPRGAGG